MNQMAESLFGSRWSTTSVTSVVILLICISGIAAYAQEQPPPPAGEGIPDQLKTYTVKNYTDWLKQYQDAKPDFKPGDTLTQKDIGRLRAFMPPGFYEMLNFPDLRVGDCAAREYEP